MKITTKMAEQLVAQGLKERLNYWLPGDIVYACGDYYMLKAYYLVTDTYRDNDGIYRNKDVYHWYGLALAKDKNSRPFKNELGNYVYQHITVVQIPGNCILDEESRHVAEYVLNRVNAIQMLNPVEFDTDLG